MNKKKKIDLSTVSFGVGQHPRTDAPTGDRDFCIMEAVAYMAGEPWSDSPACASPVVSAFLRSWNDALSDADRDRLLPAAVWVPRLVGSRGDPATEERRAYLALDWLIRVHTPAWLDLVPSLATHAEVLRALPEVVDLAGAQASKNVMDAAGATAWAARDAARDAAWAARSPSGRVASVIDQTIHAWEASGDSAVASAGDAARDAARDAGLRVAWAAAGDAAWAAAGAAAWDAGYAGSALRPTVEALQASALDLLDRMLKCGEHRRKEKE